eukprot:scaffold4612_cov88-Isochrysis_galbana.AAC.1
MPRGWGLFRAHVGPGVVGEAGGCAIYQVACTYGDVRMHQRRAACKSERMRGSARAGRLIVVRSTTRASGAK